MAAIEFYVTTLLVYFGVDVLASWALNLEFGEAGIPNFAFIIFQAAGAYTAGVLTLGSDTQNSGFQHYVLGATLPFPLPYIGAMVVGGLLAIPIGYITVLRLRIDFQAIIFLTLSIMAAALVSDFPNFLNGSAGLSLIPAPFASSFSSQGYQWFYVAMVGLIVFGAYLFFRRLMESPLGRIVRAGRDNQAAAEALGKNVLGLRLLVLVIGGAVAALSGALLVTFIGVWSPGAWTYSETVVLFGVLFIGGIGNRLGVMLGALLLPVALAEATRFLPPLGGQVGVSEAAQWIVTGCLILLFLWFRPRGLIPERKRYPGGRAVPGQTPAAPAAPTVYRHAGGGAVAMPLAGTERDSGETRVAGENVEAVVVRDLRCQFGGVVAVDGVSFTIPAGRVTGLIGPNGAGKSTVLAAMSGSLKPSGGSIVLNGIELTRLPPHKISRLGMVHTFQMAAAFARLTVLENVLVGARLEGESFWAAMRGRRCWGESEEAAVERARRLLDRAGLLEEENKVAGDLSGGQRRLLELTRVLMAEPKVLLLDEPFAGINPALADQLAAYIEQLRDDGLTVVMTEHELALVERVCDSVIVMAQGAILSEGSMDELQERNEVIEAYMGA